MGRPLRIQASELHYHVIVRCNNEAFRFESDQDFALYLGILSHYKTKHRFKLFNYELMHSHVHLFLQPSDTIPLEKSMRLISWSYARDYNKRKKRRGHLWLDRYKSIPVESDQYALDLMRYINRNAVRAGIVSKPGDWKWSGYRFYASGEANDLLEEHPTYLGLSQDPNVRRRAFREYVEMILPEEDRRRAEFSDVRWIGSKDFSEKLELSIEKNGRTYRF